MKFPHVIAACVLAASFACPADAAIRGCIPISNVPFVISVSGTYCMTKDLNYEQEFEVGSAIVVNADGVIIDLSNHVLDNHRHDAVTAIAVGDHSNVTVTNGTIRSFFYAIELGSSLPPVAANVQVTGMVFDRTLQTSILGNAIGTTVTNNRFLKIGDGSSFETIRAIDMVGTDIVIGNNTFDGIVTSVSQSAATAVSLYQADRCRIEDNEILHTTAQKKDSVSQAVIVWSAPGCTITNNDFTNDKKSPLNFGIWIIQSTGVEISGNDFTNVVTPVLIDY